jgi:DeoR/GlpR family transcriptional regulator of sugar metabolism
MRETSRSVPDDVFARERQNDIARIVEELGRARVSELADRFGVSAVTIRKDLLVLEGEQRVLRTHGGAIALEKRGMERAFDVRERLQRAEKDAIGRAAAALVADGESIALDASTTALYVARALKARGGWHQVTVMTNGLRIAGELSGVPGVAVAVPGGWVRWEARSVVGGLGEAVFGRINIQKAFMGSAGFTTESGLSDASEEEALMKRGMVMAAREVIAIVDHTKWGRVAVATFCQTSELTRVLTDSRANPEMVAGLRDLRIDVRLLNAEAETPLRPDREPAAAAPLH